jgi:hypothetical protein
MKKALPVAAGLTILAAIFARSGYRWALRHDCLGCELWNGAA